MKKSRAFGRAFQDALVLGFFLLSVLASLAANAGECKVSKPSDDVIADAIEMAQLNELELARIGNQYERETGQALQIVLVARVGSDLSDQTILRDEDASGVLTLSDIYERARLDDDSFRDIEGSKTFDFGQYLGVVRRKFADSRRTMEFSHLGFMIRNHPSAPRAEEGSEKWWWARHMLRPCENKDAKTEVELMMQRNLNVPYLWDEGSGNFFADNPHRLKIRYLIPTPQLQNLLMRAVFDNTLAYRLNSRFYNAASNWKNTEENNSNQWVLEMVAAAASHAVDRTDAQRVLAALNYRPTKVLFAGQKALAFLPGARWAAPYVTYHAEEQPFYYKGRIGEVISALSVEEFMQRNGMLYGVFETRELKKTADRQ